MRKIDKKVLAGICCAAVLAAAGAGIALAKSPTILAGSGQAGTAAGGETEAADPEGTTAPVGTADPEGTTAPAEAAAPAETAAQMDGTQADGAPDGVRLDTICVWGPVVSVDEGSITIDNQSGNSFEGEMVLTISDELSLVLDAENGFPVQVSDVQKGEVVYAYIGPAMTMSLPPVTNAAMVICQIPADLRVPEYVTVSSMEKESDGSFTLTALNGSVYHIPADCQIIPYLTRNMVRLEDVTESRTCLIWSDDAGNGEKIVLFQE